MQAANLDLLHVHGLWMYPGGKLDLGQTGNQTVCHLPFMACWIHGLCRTPHSKKLLAGWLYQNRHFKTASCLHALTHAEADSIRAFGLPKPYLRHPTGYYLPPTIQQGPTEGHRPENVALRGRHTLRKGSQNLIHAWHTLQNRRR